MDNGIIERISLIIKKYNLTERQFAIKIGKKQQSVNAMLKKANSDLMMTTVIDILRAFPEVSTDWLVMGEGDMMKATGNGDLVEALRDHISTLKENNALLKEKLSAMEAEKNMEDGKRLPVDYREKVAKGEKA